jgi:hypothetical protein
MIDNCVALAGGDNSDIDRVVSKDRAIFLFDNEPRNPDTIRRIEKAIDAGYRVSIFPESIAEKDPNEMIMKGMDREELSGIIFRNTYSGLAAKLRLAEWKKL